MELLGMFDGNLPSVVAIGAIMLVGTIGSALISNGYLSKMLNGRGKGKAAAELAGRMDRLENDTVPGMKGALDRIENKLDTLSDHVLEMERRLNYADKSALMGVIYNGSIHVFDRLRAFNNYLKLGGNGLVAEYAVRELVVPNRDDWTRVVQESKMKTHCDKYHEIVAGIGRRLNETMGAV